MRSHRVTSLCWKPGPHATWADWQEREDKGVRRSGGQGDLTTDVTDLATDLATVLAERLQGMHCNQPLEKMSMENAEYNMKLYFILIYFKVDKTFK